MESETRTLMLSIMNGRNRHENSEKMLGPYACVRIDDVTAGCCSDSEDTNTGTADNEPGEKTNVTIGVDAGMDDIGPQHRRRDELFPVGWRSL